MRKNNKKQKIVFDYSQTLFYTYDRRCQRFNNNKHCLFIECINKKIDFVHLLNKRIIALIYDSNNTVNIDENNVSYYTSILRLKVRTKKALIRQLRHLQLPPGTILNVDPCVYYRDVSDCEFYLKIK